MDGWKYGRGYDLYDDEYGWFSVSGRYCFGKAMAQGLFGYPEVDVFRFWFFRLLLVSSKVQPSKQFRYGDTAMISAISSTSPQTLLDVITPSDAKSNQAGPSS